MTNRLQRGVGREQGACAEGQVEADHPPVHPAQEGVDPHEFLMTMPSRMFATCSVASIAASRRSKRSFQRITTMGSLRPSNSDAIASRLIRSPSFLRRLISPLWPELA